MIKSFLTLLLVTLSIQLVSAQKNVRKPLAADYKVQLLWKIKSSFSDSPIYDQQSDKLFWIDLDNRKLLQLDWIEGKRTAYQTPRGMGITSVGLYNSDQVVLSLTRGVHLFDLDKKTLAPMTDPLKEDSEEMYAKLSSDPRGRLWVSSLGLKTPGRVYQVNESGSKEAFKFQTSTFGMCWSADNQTLYISDASKGVVYEAKYNIYSGNVESPKPILYFSGKYGEPRGICVNKKGQLWIAQGTAGYVGLWDLKTGKRIKKVRVPAPIATDVAFVGPNSQHLVVTTAFVPGGEKLRKKHRYAGSLFVFKTAIQGLNKNRLAIGKDFAVERSYNPLRKQLTQLLVSN
jgi:sugar lactone lactonase YvrE